MNPYSPPGATHGASQPTDPLSYLVVSERAVELLRQTRPWVMLVSVVAFVGGALLLCFALFSAVGAMFVRAATPGGKMQAAALAMVALALGLVYIYAATHLWRCGLAIARTMTSRASVDLESALAEQKSFWKLSGIAILVGVLLNTVLFAVSVAMGAAAVAGTIGH